MIMIKTATEKQIEVSDTGKSVEAENILSLLSRLITALFEKGRSIDLKAQYKAIVEYPYQKSFEAKTKELSELDYGKTAKDGAIWTFHKIQDGAVFAVKQMPWIAAGALDASSNALNAGSKGLTAIARWIQPEPTKFF